MKYLVIKAIPFALSIILALLLSSQVSAQTLTMQTPAPAEEATPTTPDLADIIPLASVLPGRLAQLKNKIKGLPDIPLIENQFSEYQQRVDGIGNQLVNTQNAEGMNLYKLININRLLRDEETYFEYINSPLGKEIRKVAAWKTEWVEEKKRWNQWKDSLFTDSEPEQIKEVFAGAYATIDTSIEILQLQLETMLRAQAKGAAVKTKIHMLQAETLALISASRTDSLLEASPQMFSADYFGQFRPELWHKTVTNLQMISWPDSRFIVRHGWILLAQLLLVFTVIFTAYRNRQALIDSEHWRFIAERPIAAGIFIGMLSYLLFPKFQVFPLSLRLANLLAGAISSFLILQSLLKPSWKRQAVYGVIILFVLMAMMAAVNLPLPLFRLYTFMASGLAFYFLWRWSWESVKNNDSPFYTWLLRFGSILAGVVVVAQFWGMDKVASYLFGATLGSLAITLSFILFMHIIQGFLHWVFYTSPVWNIKQLRSEAETLVRRSRFIINTCIVVFTLIPLILSAWGLYGSMQESATGFLSFGFDIGSQRISLGLIVAAGGTLYISFLLSWVLPKVLLDEKVAGAGMERGVRISVGRLIQYFIVFIGFLLAIMILGLDLTKLTIILSALGVGIGFGLQGIVNNFISGLILLFEQPVRIGDIIEMTGMWAEIKRIGLRSTTVRTYNESEVIIPNANLVSNEVTNWTLSNHQARLTIPVGVAYGSDIPRVIETLMACAAEHDMITKTPSPQVLFRSFGESSLDFELHVWITDVHNRLVAASQLHEEIDRRFRKANIEIAFPQRDLHLRSIDNPIIVQHSEAG